MTTKTFFYYSIIFIITYPLIFNIFFFARVTDSVQTSNMFGLISVLIALVTSALYVGAMALSRHYKVNSNWVTDLLLFFVLSEFATLIIGGVIPFFGIFDSLNKTPNGKMAMDADLLLFRKQRDFAFSVSAAISSTICATVIFLVKRSKEQKVNNS